MSILDMLSNNNTTAAAASTTETAASGKTERKPSQIWANIGAVIPGAADDGSDLFVSLPSGLPLDDMKPVQVRGTNQNSIHLKQVKNTLLDELQKLGASMAPGERRVVPLQVEIYRVAQPEQQGSADSNPLMAGLLAQFRK